jgi:hypothetical protein
MELPMSQENTRLLHLALENQQWDLAAHILILATLHVQGNNRRAMSKVKQQRKTDGKQRKSSGSGKRNLSGKNQQE